MWKERVAGWMAGGAAPSDAVVGDGGRGIWVRWRERTEQTVADSCSREKRERETEIEREEGGGRVRMDENVDRSLIIERDKHGPTNVTAWSRGSRSWTTKSLVYDADAHRIWHEIN